MTLHPVRVGCSGWNYADWRGRVYPPGCPPRRWLAHYATLFDTVEVNSTFYRLARPQAVARWLEQTPPDFRFTIKASRYLTHVRRLADMERGVERLYAGIAPLAESPRMGPMLWQLPASFHRDDDRLGFALERLPPGRHCFEFRHPSWFCAEVFGLLHTFGAATTPSGSCVSGRPGSKSCAPRPRCWPTLTTTGKASRSATASAWRGY